VPARKGLTVILVPETGKRTVTFRFSPLWAIPLILLILGLALTAAFQHRANRTLEAQLTELDSLRRTNRVQEAQIETLQTKVAETDQKLTELETLEAELREIVGQTLPSRSDRTEPVSAAFDGRGGPPDAGQTSTNLPTLGSMLPPDVRAYLFAKRDTLPMDLRAPRPKQEVPGTTTPKADDLETRVDRQLTLMEQLAVDMVESKQAILEQQDYLAHRPAGLPISGGLFTDRFGWRWSPFGYGRQWHDGLDIAQDYWTPVVAAAEGVVTYSGWMSGGYGYTVVLEHGYGFVTQYAHMIQTKSEVGEEVRRGQVIGWVGNSGNSTGPHLHYEVHVNGVPVDPVKYLE